MKTSRPDNVVDRGPNGNVLGPNSALAATSLTASALHRVEELLAVRRSDIQRGLTRAL